MTKYFLLTLAAVAFIACGKKPASEAPAQAAAADPGKTLYHEKTCATCHGEEGHGDGAVGAALNPKPRNFTDAKWAQGDDLASVIKTIENGVPGTGMAPFKSAMTPDEIKTVAEYVRKLGGKN